MAEDERRTSDRTELGSLPVEQFTPLEIQVPDCQNTNVFQIHRPHCTGRKAFRKAVQEMIGYGVKAGGEESYGDLSGRIVARLLALF